MHLETFELISKGVDEVKDQIKKDAKIKANEAAKEIAKNKAKEKAKEVVAKQKICSTSMTCDDWATGTGCKQGPTICH